MAVDSGPGALPVFTKLTLRVTDTNDNSPAVVVNALTGSTAAEVREHVDPPGTFVAHVAVTDADTGQNGATQCLLDDGVDQFRLEPLADDGEYKITTTTTFDREEVDRYAVELVCRDGGTPGRSTTATIVVTVADINDHAPELPSDVIHVSVVENNPPRTVLTTVNATDRDVGVNAQLRYSIEPEPEVGDGGATGNEVRATGSGGGATGSRSGTTGSGGGGTGSGRRATGNDGGVTGSGGRVTGSVGGATGNDVGGALLTIDPITGVVATNRTFDYEEDRHDFRFRLTVSDAGDPVRSATATLHLTVTDSNDHRPRFDRRVYHVTVPEDVPVGTSVGRVNATDDDVTPRFGHVTYALTLLSDSFKVSSTESVHLFPILMSCNII